MVLLCMLILSMVSLPTSLARKECTDFLEEALDVMKTNLLEGMKAAMEKSNKGELFMIPLSQPFHISH